MKADSISLTTMGVLEIEKKIVVPRHRLEFGGHVGRGFSQSAMFVQKAT